MSYNLLNGFCNDDPPFRINSKRMGSAIKIIEEQDPDILILTEAYLWPFAKDKIKVSGGFKNIFHGMYNEYVSLAYGNFRFAPVILSKYPILHVDTSLSKYQLNFMRIIADIDGKNTMIDVFHPHPETTEEQRIEFLKLTLKRKKEPYLLTGDFNAISPQDSYDKQKLTQGFKSFIKEKAKTAVENLLKCATLNFLLKENLVDTYKAKNPNANDFTMPTDLRSKNKDSAIRIDYIFCSDNIQVLDAGIIKSKLTEEASDHYPIYAILEI